MNLETGVETVCPALLRLPGFSLTDQGALAGWRRGYAADCKSGENPVFSTSTVETTGGTARERIAKVETNMTPPRRYGNRRIDRMLREWNDLRDAIRRADIEAIQNAFDACEEWVDFAFAPPETTKPPGFPEG